MRSKKTIPLCAFLVVFGAGCATRDNTDFHLFSVQTTILVEETVSSIRSAELLAELNLMDAIAGGNTELLENSILQRDGLFSLCSESLSILSGLVTGENKTIDAGLALGDYSMLLDEITRPGNTLFQLIPAASPNTSLLAAAIAVLVVHGKIEHDAEIVSTAMLAAAPAVESISVSMTELTEAVADAVQASYADMAARRQMSIILHENPTENVEELFALNRQVTTLLWNLEILHESWMNIPTVHEELGNSLSEASVSVTLRLLAERMNEIREEGK